MSEEEFTSLPRIGKYAFMAEPFHCDFTNRLFMGYLGNAMLNAADFHSSERGYGMHYLNTVHKTWVLSRLVIDMEQMPMGYDRFVVETWVDTVMKYFTNRNFKVTDEEGKKVFGYGKSIWAMIDTESRQPVNILEVKDGILQKYLETEATCPITKASRVPVSHDAKSVGQIQTHYSDADLNGHVNSVKYIEHALDLFDVEWYRHHWLKRIEVAYVAESYPGDILHFYMETTADGRHMIKITKGEGEEIEVVRMALTFATY